MAKRKYYVQRINDGMIQHESTDIEECHRYIRNSSALFSVSPMRVVVRDGKNFIPA